MNWTFNPDPTPGGGGAAIELLVCSVLSFAGLIIMLWLVLPLVQAEVLDSYKDWKEWKIVLRERYRKWKNAR